MWNDSNYSHPKAIHQFCSAKFGMSSNREIPISVIVGVIVRGPTNFSKNPRAPLKPTTT